MAMAIHTRRQEAAETLRQKVLIIGCPKSATVYIATLLNKLGLDFGHENHFIYMGRVIWARDARDGLSSWLLGAGYGAKPFDGQPPLEFYENPIILHQVRHPLNTMSSCQKISWEAWSYIAQHIPLEPGNLVKNCMRLWYHWNLKCERLAEWTYRIEALEEVWDEFCRRIRRPELAEKKHVLHELPKNINTAKPYRQLTWEDLERTDAELAEKIMKLAERYGYTI